MRRMELGKQPRTLVDEVLRGSGSQVPKLSPMRPIRRALPLCNVMAGEHTHGSWVNSPLAHAPCCSMDRTAPGRPGASVVNDARFCPASPDSIRDAALFRNAHQAYRVLNETPFRATPRTLAVGAGFGCSCHVAPRLWRDKYQWKPSHCRLPSWDADQFCRLLGEGRRLLFIGDSTSHQAAAEVSNAVAWDAAKGRVAAHRCQESVLFGHSDTLVGAHELLAGLLGPNRGLHWETWVERYRPDIVILNTGASIKSVHAFNATLVKVMRGFKRFPNTRFIWKSQPPAGCGPRPIHESEYAGLSANRAHFNWRLFDAFDASASDILGKRPTDNFHAFLDLSPLLLRPDAHVEGGIHDCLHLCTPGPLTLLPSLLLQILSTWDSNRTGGDR